MKAALGAWARSPAEGVARCRDYFTRPVRGAIWPSSHHGIWTPEASAPTKSAMRDCHA